MVRTILDFVTRWHNKKGHANFAAITNAGEPKFTMQYLATACLLRADKAPDQEPMALRTSMRHTICSPTGSKKTMRTNMGPLMMVIPS